MQLIALKLFQFLFLFLVLAIAGYALTFYWLQANENNIFSTKFRTLNPLLVYSHFVGGGLALLCGALQFFTKRPSNWHRCLGYLYFCSVCLGTVGGFYLALHSHLGWVTGIGFLCCDFLWISTTVTAVFFARKHEIAAHRRWILRSFALTSAAITLRLMAPTLGLFLNPDTNYILVSWMSWLTNLIIIEIYLGRTKNCRAPKLSHT